MEEILGVDIDYFSNTDNKDLYLPDPARNLSTQNNNINIFHSKFIPPMEYTEKVVYDSGEKITADIYNSSMIAVSTNSTTSYNRNKCSNKIRTVCYGRIVCCKEIRYMSENGEKCYYCMETVGHDGNTYIFEISHEAFNADIINELSHKGRLAFSKHRGYTDDDLIRTYIRASAEKGNFVYPYMPSWKNEEYIFATKKHEADTPFFQNIFSVPDNAMTEIEAFGKVLKMLKIFKNKHHRLFFLIMMAYIVLQSLFDDYLKITELISINISKECNSIVYLLLGIFNNCNRSHCALSDNQDKIDSEIHKRTGTVVFLENSAIYDNLYYMTKAKNNLKYILESKTSDIVTVIVNNDYDAYINGAFNITVNDSEIDVEVYFKTAQDKQAVCGYLFNFSKWLSKQEFDINKLQSSGASACTSDENKTKTVLYMIYMLLSEYNDSISETALSEKLRFYDNKEVFSAIETVCEEKDDDNIGDWIVKRFGEVYRELCSKGLCQKIYLKKNTEFSFDDDKITFIEKDEMICILEKDMKKLINRHIPELTLGRMKVSMSEADALEHDKNNPYLKNIYIPCMKRAVRLMAVKKPAISSAGEINL